MYIHALLSLSSSLNCIIENIRKVLKIIIWKLKKVEFVN